MVLPSSACTQMWLWTFYPVSLHLCEIAHAPLRQRCLQHLRLKSWSMSGLLSNTIRRNPQLVGCLNHKDLWHPTAKHGNKKKFNLMTYKYHALGHYVDTIWCFGTTDSYFTQPVSVCMIMLTFVVGIRASLSTTHPKLNHFRWAADQYHSKYQRLSDESTVSAWSVRGWLVPNSARHLI